MIDQSSGHVHSDRNLSKKIVKGGVWIAALRILSQLLILSRIVILARILAPSDFGLIGVALLAMSTIEALTQTGILQALVQKRENIEDFLDTAWTILLIRGFVLFFIVFFSSSYIASFFNIQYAENIIIVVGIVIIIQSFTNIGIVSFQKEMAFDRQFFYQFSGTLADFTVTVIAAIILRNVWAFVLGLIAGNLVSCVASYVIHPYRPVLSFKFKKIKHLFAFGKWISGSSILIYIGTVMDDIFVGKFISAASLGFYQMAYKISDLPASEITFVIGRVAFPAYSKLQENIGKLRQLYFKIMSFTILISTPIAVGVILLGKEFILLFLGEKWLPMLQALQILAFSGMIKSFVATGSSLFVGGGKASYAFYMQLVRAVLLMAFIYPLTITFDIRGSAIAVLISMLGMSVIWLILSKKITGASMVIYIKTLFPPLLSAVAMSIVIYFLQLWLLSYEVSVFVSFIIFFAIGATGVLVYLVIVYLFQFFRLNINPWEDVMSIYKLLRR